ncbi:MAG: dephospho-CoA kinase [Angelakisella sp.]
MIVGLTGPTGAGKSLVASMLREWQGVEIIDCDQLSRRVASKGNRCLVDLAVEFSPLIIDKNGDLNRRKLAQIVFNDQKKLERLNAIIFPYILEEAELDILKAQQAGAKLIVLDAPTLFESGADALCDKIVVITADDTTRLGRIMKRDKITADEAARRMGSQHTDEYFASHADYIVSNSGDTVELRLAVLELLNALGL